MLLFFMLKWTKILLYLEQQQKCFAIMECATSLVQFLKEKKVYKITSRKNKQTPTIDIFDRRFTHVSLCHLSVCFFLVSSANCPCSSSYSFCYTWVMSSKHEKLLFPIFINVFQLISLFACWQPAKITLWWIVERLGWQSGDPQCVADN